MSEPVQKNAVIVGKVILAPKREVVIAKKPAPKAPEPRQERPRRQDRPSDPRTANTAVLAELQYLKKQISSLKEQLEAARAGNAALTQQVADLQAQAAAKVA